MQNAREKITNNPEIFQMLDRLEDFIWKEKRRARSQRTKTLLGNLNRWQLSKRDYFASR